MRYAGRRRVRALLMRVGKRRGSEDDADAGVGRVRTERNGKGPTEEDEDEGGRRGRRRAVFGLRPERERGGAARVWVWWRVRGGLCVEVTAVGRLSIKAQGAPFACRLIHDEDPAANHMRPMPLSTPGSQGGQCAISASCTRDTSARHVMSRSRPDIDFVPRIHSLWYTDAPTRQPAIQTQAPQRK